MDNAIKILRDFLRALPFNSYGRLRSGWRFLIFLFAFLFVSTVSGALLFVALTRPSFGFDQKSLAFQLGANLISFLAAVFVGWLCGRFFEDLPFRALGWTFSDGWLKHLILGSAFGTLVILLAALVGMLFGGLSFQVNQAMGGSAILLTLGVSLLIFVVGAASEEAIFRGYMLQTFGRSNLFWFGILLTSVLFASAHNSNPSANPLSWFNTLLAGITFAVSYLKTRTLWLSFGLHLMWNWVQGAVLGITVSGLKELTTAPLLQATDASPAWLTGGEYGIEGGIACTIALVITTIAIWFAPFLKPTAEMLALTDEERFSEPKNDFD